MNREQLKLFLKCAANRYIDFPKHWMVEDWENISLIVLEAFLLGFFLGALAANYLGFY